MAILKNSVIKEIQNIIENSNNFSRNDFKFEFPDKGNVLALIQYRASKQYSFSIEENIINNFLALGTVLQNKEAERVLQTRQKPGNHKNEEISTCVDIDECIREVRTWLFNLDTELKSEIDFDIESISDIDDFEVKLNEKFKNDREKFTDIEKENLLKKLNELQQRIEQLEQDANSKKLIENIEQSKNELATYPKKSWWLKFFNRVKSINQGADLALEIKNKISQLLEFTDNVFN